MKSILWDHVLKFHFPSFLLTALIVLGVLGCTTDENELGRDLLPPGDNIFVFYDTLDDILTYPVARTPYIISENRYNPQSTRLFLLGNKRDTISGFAKADIVTQFNPTSSFVFGPNMQVDSLVLYLYVNESIMDILRPINIKIYELTERIYMDSVYYTNFDITGKISPEPIAEKKIIPADSTLFEFVIESPAFINKFINPPNDTLFYSDSLFKDYFNGLYITSDDLPEGGFFSKVHLANNNTKLSIKYANDSTAIDTLPGYNYVWRTFSINEYSSQKINIFNHDFSGTTFETILNNPDSKSPVLYVQGMNGVHTQLRMNNLEPWLDSGIIAINHAQLIFEVLPETLSGISKEDLPERLILVSDLGDGKTEPLYDYVVDQASYDGYLRAVTDGVFFDTTYVYKFNIGLHYQNLIDGKIENRNLILQPYDARTNLKFVKLWSNYYDHEGSLHLKIIYTKL